LARLVREAVAADSIEERHDAWNALAALCRRHRIRWLSLFGSVLKGTAAPDSDVDLLVEFEHGARPSFLDLADIEQELSALLGDGAWTCSARVLASATVTMGSAIVAPAAVRPNARTRKLRLGMITLTSVCHDLSPGLVEMHRPGGEPGQRSTALAGIPPPVFL
jgi:predicted nucleotidyltransferase